MAYGRVAATVVCVLLLTSAAARAGFDAGVLIQKSPQLEQTVSHILVGRLVAYHQAKSAPGRYVAEVEVSGVEKGEGISPGARIYVHFSSPRTLAQIKTERVVPDCGDRKIDPLPGEWLRVYTQLNGDYEYVADHPDCFFYTGRKPPDGASIRPPVLIGSTLALLGLAAGSFVWAGRRGRTPRPASVHV